MELTYMGLVLIVLAVYLSLGLIGIIVGEVSDEYAVFSFLVFPYTVVLSIIYYPILVNGRRKLFNNRKHRVYGQKSSKWLYMLFGRLYCVDRDCDNCELMQKTDCGYCTYLNCGGADDNCCVFNNFDCSLQYWNKNKKRGAK